jgi:glycosyltransferase A (GT-A) superfamily protein (DUF2064 family)
MTTVLVVAKAPVAGLAKTRLIPIGGPRQAAKLAAAALLDTVTAVLATPATLPVVAMTGELADAERAAELRDLLRHCTVIAQRGRDFAERLANAHADVVHFGRPVLQVGMDTPQLTPRLLTESIDRLCSPGVDAVLGPATDGGWWALGLRSPAHAHVLRDVPMSRADTGARTRAALVRAGLRTADLLPLSDVDTVADAIRVADATPTSRFAEQLADVLAGRRIGAWT